MNGGLKYPKTYKPFFVNQYHINVWIFVTTILATLGNEIANTTTPFLTSYYFDNIMSIHYAVVLFLSSSCILCSFQSSSKFSNYLTFNPPASANSSLFYPVKIKSHPVQFIPIK